MDMKKSLIFKISKYYQLEKISPKKKIIIFRSFTFTINVQNKLYSISIARLPGEIEPERCSIKV